MLQRSMTLANEPGKRIMNRTSRAILIAAVALTSVSAYTCIRIEVFNASVGGLLPRSPDTEYGTISTWRCASMSSVRQRMEWKFLNEANEAGRPAVLTEAQQEAITAAQREAVLNNEFREFVGSWGLWQYIVAPLGVVLTLLLPGRRNSPRLVNTLAAAAVLVSSSCVVMMIYRGYFSSLGW